MRRTHTCLGTMKVLRLLTIAILPCMWSCAAGPGTRVPQSVALARFRLKIEDQPGDRRFALTLTSLDDRSLCILIYDWPSDGGEIHFGSSRVVLQSRGRRFPIKDVNFGYCLDANGRICRIEIAPHKQLKGFIGYLQFGHSETIAQLPARKLHFQVTPFVCE